MGWLHRQRRRPHRRWRYHRHARPLWRRAKGHRQEDQFAIRARVALQEWQDRGLPAIHRHAASYARDGGLAMFVGHYAAAFAAKAIEPKTPLWTLAAGCQLIDIGWSSFIMAGIEHASADPSLPGSSLVLYDMPWTHSLPGAAAWSVGAALLCLALLRLGVWPSVLVGFSVFSHWLLDLLVHRPDLQLY